MVSKVWGRRHLPALHTHWQMHTHHLSSSYRVVFSSTRVLHSTYFRKHCDYLCCVFSMKYFQEKIFFLIRRNSKKKKSHHLNRCNSHVSFKSGHHSSALLCLPSCKLPRIISSAGRKCGEENEAIVLTYTVTPEPACSPPAPCSGGQTRLTLRAGTSQYGETSMVAPRD